MLLFTRMVAVLFLLKITEAENKPGQRAIHRLVGGHLRLNHDDHLDTVLITSESGGRESRQQKINEDEDKKTLSQQVADGKYGLIQKELFAKPPKRPGVLSYESNSEVPKDNIANLGGLNKNDIWLAENHLLVLKGGKYPQHEEHSESTPSVWPPIDDYKAPNRQVKIPAHPKVPPPFPVQLTDDGPLQILGTNSSRTINGTLESPPYSILPPEEGFIPEGGPFFPPPYPYPPNVTAGEAPFPIPPYPPGDYYPGSGPPPFPFPVNGTLPPFFANLPPGAAFLPPPGNQTEPIDEDDPSIYYPPPYSFFYPKDNSTEVPPGPLVPGIVLPPPPNFFGPLEANRKTKARTTTEQTQQIHPTTTPLPPTSVVDNNPFNNPLKIPINIPETNNEIKQTTLSPPQIVTSIPATNRVKQNQTTSKKPYIPVERHPSHRKKPSVTILRPITTTIPPQSSVQFHENEVSGKPFKVYGPPPSSTRSRTIVSTTQVPLKTYFSTSNEIETRPVTQIPEQKYYTRNGISTLHAPKTTTKSPMQYYFYEEEKNHPQTLPALTEQKEPSYLNIPKEYYVPAKQIQQPEYIYVNQPYTTQRPYQFVQAANKPEDTFGVHIARLKQQLHSYYPVQRPRKEPYYHQTPHPTPKPIYQFSFEAANYQQQTYKPPQEDVNDKFRPIPRYSVQIQPAIEVIPSERPRAPVYYQTNTERPAPQQYYPYEENRENKYVVTPRPISQYSFEATQNPIYEQGYYTKQDETYFDDITKKYFTMFGKKLANTSPIPNEEVNTPKPYYVEENLKPNVYDHNSPKPISLHDDTYVNYVRRPIGNPNAEYVPKFVPRYQNQPQSLHDDIDVNYRQRRPQTNKNAEIIQAVNVKENKPSYISYQLPGDDGAHFYFLTPQLAQRRNQGTGYYYSQPNTNSRIRRNDRGNGS